MTATKLCDGAHGCGQERPLEEFRMLSHGRRAAYCHACELAHGVAVVYGGYRSARRCAGCGCGWDERTAGCPSCGARHRLRARAKAAVA